MKRLYKSTTNKIVTGFLGGLGEYWNIDPVILRVAFIFIGLFTGIFPGVIAYLVASLIVPVNPIAAAATEPKTEPAPETSEAKKPE